MGGVSSLSELGSSGREPCFVRTGVRPLLTQFESRKRAPGLGGLNSFRLVPRSPSSFVLCGAPAPNGSFVNHQQLFGSVCKTGGLRITALFLGLFVPKFILQKIPRCLSREKRVVGEIRNVCLM